MPAHKKLEDVIRGDGPVVSQKTIDEARDIAEAQRAEYERERQTPNPEHIAAIIERLSLALDDIYGCWFQRAEGLDPQFDAVMLRHRHLLQRPLVQG